jgi:flagellar transcriptional activator FlhD
LIHQLICINKEYQLSTDPHLNDTRDINLSYLMLAQAVQGLGIAEPMADLLAQMSPQQLVRVASRNLMLCMLRFDDELIWGLLTGEPLPHQEAEPNAAGLHASVLMAGRYAVGAP